MSTAPIPIPHDATIGVPIPDDATIGAPAPPSPKGFWASVGSRLQVPFSPGPTGEDQPRAMPSGPVTDNAWDQQKQVLKDSFNEMVDNVTHPSQLLHMLPGWDEIKQKLTPREVEQWQNGDKAGAVGTGLVDIANMFTGGKTAAAPEAAGAPIADAGAAAVRGTVKGANAVLHNAPDVLPSVIVPPVAKKIASKLTIPGEDFGVDYYDKSILPDRAAPMQAPQTVNPVPQPVAAQSTAAPSAADRAAYLEGIKAKRQAMGLVKPEGAVETPAAPAPPSEDDVAKGIGYSGGAKQAQQRLGPDQWQATYQKIVAPASNKPVIDAESAEKPALNSGTTPPNLSTEAPKPSTPADVVDAAIPPSANKALNMKTKAEVDFYVQKGDVEGAKAAIQNAASKLTPKPGTFADAQEDAGIQQFMRQDLQSQYGKGRLVEGREQAAGNSADRTKLAGIPKQGEQFATRLTRYPAPEGDMEANKMLGYDQHATPQPVQTPSERPNEQPWGGLSEQDLTAVLQKSVDLAKNARKLQTK